MLMFQPLKRYADFQGRARRSEYWLYTLFIVIAMCVTTVVDHVVFGEDRPFLTALFGLAIFVPSLAVSIRRLHDTNRSGWWYLITLIPFFGGIIYFVFSVLDGTPGSNRFGPDPKGRGVENTAETFS